MCCTYLKTWSIACRCVDVTTCNLDFSISESEYALAQLNVCAFHIIDKQKNV